MKTYTGKCPINRGNGDLICKGINTLNILDTVLVSMMAPQLLEWNQSGLTVPKVYDDCRCTGVTSPSFRLITLISIWSGCTSCLLWPETCRRADCRQQMDGFLSFYLDDALFLKLLFVGSRVAPLQRKIICDCRDSCFYLIPFTRHSNGTSSPPTLKILTSTWTRAIFPYSITTSLSHNNPQRSKLQSGKITTS